MITQSERYSYLLIAPEHRRHEFLSAACNTADVPAILQLEILNMIIGQ